MTYHSVNRSLEAVGHCPEWFSKGKEKEEVTEEMFLAYAQAILLCIWTELEKWATSTLTCVSLRPALRSTSS